METNDGTAAGEGFDRKNIEPEWNIAGVVLAEKLAGRSGNVSLLLAGDGIFRGTKFIAGRGSRLHLDKCECRPIVSDKINFSFDAAHPKISRDHDVPLPAEIPVGVSFSAYAGPPRLVPGRFSRQRSRRFGEAIACGPIH